MPSDDKRFDFLRKNALGMGLVSSRPRGLGIAEEPERSDLMRVDGTQKGLGWLGPKKHLKTGGTATEISVGVNLDGQETLIPLMVPGLNEMELMYLLANDPEDPEFQAKMPRSILDKAVGHAMQRIGLGLSPFKD